MDALPTHYYRPDKIYQHQVGMAGECVLVGDTEPTRTKMVLAVNYLTGEFWTKDGHYKPCPLGN